MKFAALIVVVGVAAGGLAAESKVQRGTAAAISDELWADMQGVSWHEGKGCPDREDLRLLSMPFNDFSGQVAQGRMIVAADVAENVLDIFAEIAESGFAIEKMQLIDDFAGDDDVSMAANNTSGFNCRATPGSTRLSQHAYGRAIDINPVQNPYLFQGKIMPPAGAAYDSPKKRKAAITGIIRKEGAVVGIFARHGWGWGGDWRNSKDYQHFSMKGS